LAEFDNDYKNFYVLSSAKRGTSTSLFVTGMEKSPQKTYSMNNNAYMQHIKPGDWIVFENPYLTDEWHFENAIYDGGGLFFAHPIGNAFDLNYYANWMLNAIRRGKAKPLKPREYLECKATYGASTDVCDLPTTEKEVLNRSHINTYGRPKDI
jgi:hypothetical protein